MKGKRRIPPILVSALLTAGMLFCNGTSVQAELNFGELGSENNQIAAPAAGITASPEAVALDDLGISTITLLQRISQISLHSIWHRSIQTYR